MGPTIRARKHNCDVLGPPVKSAALGRRSALAFSC